MKHTETEIVLDHWDCGIVFFFFAVRSFSFHPLLQLSNQSRWICNLKEDGVGHVGWCSLIERHPGTRHLANELGQVCFGTLAAQGVMSNTRHVDICKCEKQNRYVMICSIIYDICTCIIYHIPHIFIF